MRLQRQRQAQTHASELSCLRRPAAQGHRRLPCPGCGTQPTRESSHLCSAQLPVYVPSEAEAADPALYAGNVRAYMVRARPLPCTWEIRFFQRLAVCMLLTPHGSMRGAAAACALAGSQRRHPGRQARVPQAAAGPGAVRRERQGSLATGRKAFWDMRGCSPCTVLVKL